MEGGPVTLHFFFVKRSVSLSSSSWQLGIGCCKTFDLHAPRPSKTGPETGHFRVLFRQWTPLWRRQFDIDENETNCVNYKYCLVDAPGVSNSCID